MADKNSLLKQIPKVDVLMDRFDPEKFSRGLLKVAVNSVLEALRNCILAEGCKTCNEQDIVDNVTSEYQRLLKGSLETVVNATGVVIHTNLGRSPISEAAFDRIKPLVCGYSNLEYDIKNGERGERYHHIKEFLQLISGAEDAVIVNNNAAAVFLILNTFSKNKEAIVSRGELIEIGGSFRIPDVMDGSGAILKEVGTTNKTKAEDYVSAVNDQTAMMMKVHTSNYKIVGFTEEVSLADMPKIANHSGVMSYYDAGSGAIARSAVENCNEPSLAMLVNDGFDLISASGDKMLGGPQAGIIIGKKSYIDQIKQNPLMRMLRVDKLTLSLLQETMKSYLLGDESDIPAVQMLKTDVQILRRRANRLKQQILKKSNCVEITVETDRTYIGGGSCPMSEIDTVVLEVKIDGQKATRIEKQLRLSETPIIGRIKNDTFILDVRTILDNQFSVVAAALSTI